MTTISVSKGVAERLRALRAKLGARSWDELLEAMANALERTGSAADREEVLEALSALYSRARERATRGDYSALEEFVVFVERKLSPLLSRFYEEAKTLLQSAG